MYCKSPRASLFNDLPSAEADAWLSKMSFQPAEGWNDVVTYCGWKDIPSTYLVCERDAVFPPEMQRQCAKMAGSEIETCSAGHMVMLSQPERVVEVVVRAAEK